MILDNSGIDYSRMLLILLFVFDSVIYWKIGTKFSRLLAPPATPGLRLDYKVVTSKL